MLDAAPLVAGASPSGLHLVGDEDATVALDDSLHDAEVLLRRNDETADAEDRFGDEAGDLAARGGLNDVFDILSALDAAVGIALAERAAIAVGSDGVMDAGDGRTA